MEMEQVSSYNPLNPDDPILPNGVPTSDQKNLIQFGAAAYLTILVLAQGLLPERVKKGVMNGLIAYSIFQILLVVFVILPEKEKQAAESFQRAVQKARALGRIPLADIQNYH